MLRGNSRTLAAVAKPRTNHVCDVASSRMIRAVSFPFSVGFVLQVMWRDGAGLKITQCDTLHTRGLISNRILLALPLSIILLSQHKKNIGWKLLEFET